MKLLFSEFPREGIPVIRPGRVEEVRRPGKRYIAAEERFVPVMETVQDIQPRHLFLTGKIADGRVQLTSLEQANYHYQESTAIPWPVDTADWRVQCLLLRELAEATKKLHFNWNGIGAPEWREHSRVFRHKVKAWGFRYGPYFYSQDRMFSLCAEWKADTASHMHHRADYLLFTPGIEEALDGEAALICAWRTWGQK